MPDAMVIDLGEVRQEPNMPSLPPGVRRRPLLAAAVTLLLPGVLAGSVTSPRRLTGIEVPGVPSGMLSAQGNRIFVMEVSPGDVDLVVTLSGYRLDNGARLWKRTISLAGRPYSYLNCVGDALLLIQRDQDVDGSTVIALDAATGRERWRRAGGLLGWAPGPRGGADRVLMRVDQSQGTLDGYRENPPAPPQITTAVDLVTGDVRWSYRSPAGSLVTTRLDRRSGPYGVGAVITALPSGRVEVRDRETARLLVAATLREGFGAIPTDQIPQWLILADDLILVLGPRQDTLTAYGAHRLDKRWQVRWDGGGVDWYYGQVCAGLLCLQSSSGRYRGLDPRTGRLLWDQPWAYVIPLGDTLLATRTPQVAGGESALALIDPATGRERRALGVWNVVDQSMEQDEVLLFRLDAESGRAWLAVLDPGAEDVRLLGSLPEGTHACVSLPGSVVCRRPNSSLGIWRYR